MSHFEIAVTVYSAVSTIGAGLAVWHFRKLIAATELRVKASIFEEARRVRVHAAMIEGRAEQRVQAVHKAIHDRVEAAEQTAKNDISRVEKWITDHAEELKQRAEDLRVRALDLHDKTAATGATRQPPTRS